MDKIFLNGLKVDTLIGVYDWERTQKQTLLFDLEVCLPERSAPYGDDLAATVNYAALSDAVRTAAAQQQFLLLETLAEFTAGLILAQFDAAAVSVRITKPGILAGVREVGVEIKRSRAA